MKWKEGEYLVLIVDKTLAGLAEVSGKPFVSNERVWDNGIFPNRIPIRFVHISEKAKRPRIEEIEDVLISALGKKYVWGIVLQKVVSGDDAKRIIDAIRDTPNALERTIDDIDKLLDESKSMIGEKKTSVRL
jgi:hypothetical protein